MMWYGNLYFLNGLGSTVILGGTSIKEDRVRSEGQKLYMYENCQILEYLVISEKAILKNKLLLPLDQIMISCVLKNLGISMKNLKFFRNFFNVSELAKLCPLPSTIVLQTTLASNCLNEKKVCHHPTYSL